MKKLLTVLALILTVHFSQAQAVGQEYRTALGVKIYPGAITVKHFIRPNVALEGLASFWNYGFRFTGLYELHQDIRGARGLKWYVGAGAHIGFYNDDWRRRYDDREDDDLDIGLDGVLGLDYKIKGVPFNISVDWQPSFTIIEHTDFRSWGGFAIRYTFK
jgi:hypothetical protein